MGREAAPTGRGGAGGSLARPVSDGWRAGVASGRACVSAAPRRPPRPGGRAPFARPASGRGVLTRLESRNDCVIHVYVTENFSRDQRICRGYAACIEV